jgi:hypothetical protein
MREDFALVREVLDALESKGPSLNPAQTSLGVTT